MTKSIINNRAAAGVLQYHLGQRPRQLQPVHGGLNNYVFEARVGAERLVLRISTSPEKLQVFMKEQWAVTAARRKRIPTPEILEVSNEVIGLPYMISRKVEGHPAELVGHRRTSIIGELGHYAAIINSIRTHDYGNIFDWSPNKLSRNRTWPEYLERELEVDERLEILRRSGVLTGINLRKLSKQVALMRNWSAKPTLSHGDLRLKNIILDENGKICAILDWENCTSHVAPYWELSIALHDLTMDERQSFLEGYGLSLKEFVRLAPAIKALNVLNYATTVSHALERHNHSRLELLRARLNGSFDLYSL